MPRKRSETAELYVTPGGFKHIQNSRLHLQSDKLEMCWRRT